MIPELPRDLIPMPRQLRATEDDPLVLPRTWGFTAPPAEASLAIDAWHSAHAAGYAPPLSESSAEHESDAVPVRFSVVARTDLHPSLDQPESYRLSANSHGLTIEAPDAAGLFYAVQTWLQVLADTRPGRSVIALEIQDFPAYPWRGLHLDVCRHYFEVDFICRLLDLMALYKLNRFHWHLTEDQAWRLEIPGHPRLTQIGAFRDPAGYGGYYTASDVKRVVDYAAARAIEVVPEIELPGHCRAALAAYPQYSCRGVELPVETEWGIFDDIYCAGNEAVFEFLEEVLTAVASLFPSRYFHLGGDECPGTRWLECSLCQEVMKRERLDNTASLHSWFVRRAGEVLERNGKRWIGWDEICDAETPAGAIVMSWRGTEGGLRAALAGHDAILAPTQHCYFDYKQEDSETEPGRLGVIPWEQVYAFQPCPVDFPEHLRHHLLGIQANLWTEGMPQPSDVEFMTLPRLPVLAEVAWSDPDSRCPDDMRRRLLRHAARWESMGYAHRPIQNSPDGRRSPERSPSELP